MNSEDHEEMVTEGTCPRCGDTNIWRESCDVGVGVIYGPYGCQCGWSEDWEYDKNNQTQVTEDGYTKDQWGGLTPKGGHW
jgi:predicted RNA-binding Zn-ribbon protein involved in translation (DUF1610 family)